MTYLIDTNLWIEHLRGRKGASLPTRIAQIDSQEVVICTIVRAELLAGAYKSRDPFRGLTEVHDLCSLFPSLSFDEKAADEYGRVRANLEKAGTPIGGNDLMIAAIALANNLIVVTHNVSEFSRITQLRVEDWQ